MITGKVWKAGHSYVVTIPREEMAARGLHAGQVIGIDPIPLELRPRDGFTPEQRAAGRKTQEEVARDLAERLDREVAAGLLTTDEVTQAEEEGEDE